VSRSRETFDVWCAVRVEADAGTRLEIVRNEKGDWVCLGAAPVNKTLALPAPNAKSQGAELTKKLLGERSKRYKPGNHPLDEAILAAISKPIDAQHIREALGIAPENPLAKCLTRRVAKLKSEKLIRVFPPDSHVMWPRYVRASNTNLKVVA